MAMAVSRPPKDWLKFKIPNAPAVKREAAEEWGKATSYEFPSVRYPTDMHTTGALRCISAGISRPSRATKHTYGGGQASRSRHSSGVLLGGNSAIDHPMPLENQAQNATNVLPFRRNSLREPPLCAQCRAPMKIDRCEPVFGNSTSMMVTYRCAECRLLERAQIQN